MKKIVIFIFIHSVCSMAKIIYSIHYFREYENNIIRFFLIAYIIFLIFNILYRIGNMVYINVKKNEGSICEDDYKEILKDSKLLKLHLFELIENEGLKKISIKEFKIMEYNKFKVRYYLIDILLCILLVIINNEYVVDILFYNSIHVIIDFFARKCEENSYKNIINRLN